MRQHVVGVMGGSDVSATEFETARKLGGLIARRGWLLLNGGRNTGVMAASAAGAKEAGGTVIGILPDATSARASADLDIAIMTGLGDARNLINVLSSDVVIACPGRLGTLGEIAMALDHDKRVILLGYDLGEEWSRYRRGGQLTRVETPEEAVEQADQVLRDARPSE